jgi:hypothetical protein
MPVLGAHCTNVVDLTARLQIYSWEMEASMTHPMISAIAVAALIVAGTVMLRSRSPSIELSAGTAAMPTLQALYTMAGVNKLPVKELDDQSLVYPTVPKR